VNARADRRAHLASSYLSATRKSWHSFPLITRSGGDIAALTADWGLWLKILFVYRPLGYWHLAAMAVRAVLYRFGINSNPKCSMDRLVDVVGLVARRSEKPKVRISATCPRPASDVIMRTCLPPR
jgi:hypothetical protein